MNFKLMQEVEFPTIGDLDFNNHQELLDAAVLPRNGLAAQVLRHPLIQMQNESYMSLPLGDPPEKIKIVKIENEFLLENKGKPRLGPHDVILKLGELGHTPLIFGEVLRLAFKPEFSYPAEIFSFGSFIQSTREIKGQKLNDGTILEDRTIRVVASPSLWLFATRESMLGTEMLRKSMEMAQYASNQPLDKNQKARPFNPDPVRFGKRDVNLQIFDCSNTNGIHIAVREI